MPFSPAVKEEVLVRSRRCCCICHRFAGLYVATHHIQQEADGGPNTIENAVALCFECHGQAGHYNPAHPIGNKFKPSEIKRHRNEWWQWCLTNPDAPLPDKPITISPRDILLPSSSPPVSGDISVPVEIELHNRSTSDLYSIWTRLPLSTANLEESDLQSENAVGPLLLKPDFIQEHTGRVTLKLQSEGSGLPNYNFSQTALLVSTSADGAIAYLGFSRLRPGERRAFTFRIFRRESVQDDTMPIQIASFSESPCMWLLEKDNSSILDFTIPDATRFRKGEFHICILNIAYQKRD